MNNLPELALAIALVSLAVAFIVLAVAYQQLVIRLRKQRKENEFLRYNAKEKATALLDNARDSGLQIIAEANVKAKDILQSVHTFNSNADEQLQQRIDEVAKRESDALLKVSNDLLATYQQGLDAIKADSINVFKTASKDIENKVLNQVQEYVSLLEKETVGSQKIVDTKLQEAAERIAKELETYKAEKMQKFDERFYQALQIAIEDVLGKTIRMEEHQQIVLDALANAKQDMQKALL